MTVPAEVYLDDHLVQHPIVTATDQICKAELNLDRHIDDYLHFPFSAVDQLVEGIAPASVGFVAAFSGNGKTAYMASCIKLWLRSNKRIYVMPLESEPNVFRTQLACQELGYHPGMLMSGKYKETLPAAEWLVIRDAVKTSLRSQMMGNMAERLFVSPATAIHEANLIESAEHAAKLKADVLIVDHIDQVAGGNGTNLHAESVKIVNTTLELAKHYQLRIIATSQLNNEMLRGDPLGIYHPPQSNHVYMGGKKRQVAAWFLGLFRPMKLDSSADPGWTDKVKKVRGGEAEPQTILEPNCMGISVMKHRLFGEREGKRAYLRVHHGRVEDFPERDKEGLQHHIPTSQKSAY